MTPEQRYNQAIRKARIQGRISLCRMLEGLEPFAECVMDLERKALIKELERAFDAGVRSAISTKSVPDDKKPA